MPYFAALDGNGDLVYFAATGTGSTGDPFVPTKTFTNALPAGTAVIGKVDQGTGGVSAWKVDGSAVTQPVSAVSLPLPTGAATQTTQASILTALQGTVAVSGTFYQATQPISAASLPLPTGAATAANQPTLVSGRVPVDGSAVTQPVSGTFWQATQPVSAAALPLPSGAATQTTQASILSALQGTLTVAGGASTLSTATATIAATLSSAVDLAGAALIRILMPASWTTAVLTFSVSQDNVTFYDLYDLYGVEYTVQAAASRAIILSPLDFIGWRYVKVRSGTSGATVSQGASRDLTLITRPVA